MRIGVPCTYDIRSRNVLMRRTAKRSRIFLVDIACRSTMHFVESILVRPPHLFLLVSTSTACRAVLAPYQRCQSICAVCSWPSLHKSNGARLTRVMSCSSR
ncbi:hypothetical protein DL89DRAFT_167712 [Linderina pennispora]|uniref:Uncharacterized protein n=1 Tax=Linderina pennispora TaxID=61395 RepID=A0A1Y1VTL7_9FUNG|nr:uncharacterized protein DL89DRAFT_167712 [Linderina pennispora]ORX64640.1 hypothetical protein DL89DRAFT_167712 [Linderina pennispora]